MKTHILWLNNHKKSHFSQIIPALIRACLPEKNHQIFTFKNLISTLYLHTLFHDSKYCSRFNLFIAPKFCVKDYLMTRHWIVFKKLKQTSKLKPTLLRNFTGLGLCCFYLYVDILVSSWNFIILIVSNLKRN